MDTFEAVGMSSGVGQPRHHEATEAAMPLLEGVRVGDVGWGRVGVVGYTLHEPSGSIEKQFGGFG